LTTVNDVAAAGIARAKLKAAIEQARPMAKAWGERTLMAAEPAVDRVVFIAPP
jgi:hypothetical protein